MSGSEVLAFVGVIQLGCQGVLSTYRRYRGLRGLKLNARNKVKTLTRDIAGFRQLDIDWSSSTIPSDLVEFNLVVSELEGILEKHDRRGFRNVLRHLLDAEEFTEALEKVKQKQIDVHTAAHIKGLEMLAQGNKKIDSLTSDSTEIRAVLDQQMKEQRQNQFRGWLSAPGSDGDHHRLTGEMAPESGAWVVNTPQVHDWISNDEPGITWIHGRPGSGKSVIASNIVNHLLDRHGGDSGVAIAYIYHDFRNPQKFGSINQVICAIISQLCDRLDEIPDQLIQFSEKHRSPAALRIQHIVWVAEKLQSVYLAIDGLDEWHWTRRGELLGLLLQLRNETSVTFKILITSRFENQISFKLGDCKTIDLVQEADQDTGDVERVMRATVDKMLHGGDLYLQDPTRKGEIVSLLTSKSQGIFLWARLALEDLCGVSVQTKEDRSTFKCLETLPSGMDEFYERILKRILEQRVLGNLVKQSLGWLCYSKRPLAACELESGLSYDRSLDAPKINQILSACRPLVTEYDGSVQFVHFSFKQYLEDKKEGESFGWLLETLPAITDACLKCLCDVKNRWRPQINAPRGNLFIRFPFSQHAADHWGHYAAEALPHDKSGSLGQDIEDLLLTEDFVAASGRLMSPIYSVNDHWPFPSVNDLDLHGAPDAMHLVAYFGLHTLIPKVISKGIESTPYPEPDGMRTPLAWAARYGHRQCVRELARNYPDHINCKDRQGLTPLSWAAINGHEDVIRELARSPRLDAACRDDEGRTAISFAAEFGYTWIVEFLGNLDDSVVDASDDDDLTPLYWAAYGNHIDTVKLLIEQFEVQATLNTLLVHTIESDSVAIARYLIKGRRVNPFAVHESGEIPFLVAVERGNKDIVEIMDRQWNIGKSSQEFHIRRQMRKEIYGSALLTAIAPDIPPIFNYTHQQWLIQTLLPKADVNYTGSNGRTPLIAASANGSRAVVEMLLKDPNINVNKTDETQKSAWLYAQENNDLAVMEMLQNRGAIVQVDLKEIYSRFFTPK